MLPVLNDDLLTTERKDPELREIIEELSVWLKERLKNYQYNKSGKIRLVLDIKSAIFDYFLGKHGLTLGRLIDSGEIFLKTDHALMDIYDEFRNEVRNRVNEVFIGFVMIFITKEVRRWVQTINRHLSNAHSYSSLLLLLNDEDYEELLDYLNSNQDSSDTGDSTDGYMEE